MLTRRLGAAEPAIADTALRRLVIEFLALNERPGCWTFFHASALGDPALGRPAPPDIVLDVGGRIAYVEVRRQGDGPLSSANAAGLSRARSRGAACFVIRSLPDMERALRSLGVHLRPLGRLLDGAQPYRRRDGEGPDARST